MSSLPPHLQGLNEKQLEAVTHGPGPLLIFAGAGSGKTRVLTRRLANLIFTKAAHPMEIMAVTFTNKAANEMKSRVSDLLMGNRYPLWVSTFHSNCARLLRSHAEHLGFTPNFAIYDSADSLSVVKRILKQNKISSADLPPKTILDRLDYLKNNYIDLDTEDDPYLFFSNFEKRVIIDICLQYQQELLKANAMDFGDLICNVLHLFKLQPQILENYQNYFKYILVDEYQDTNRAQYLLIRGLCDKYKNICVVGDDDQSIYAFRGANIKNILNFRRDFPDAHVVKLEINYRSTKNIILAASSVISKNKEREKKNITTINPKGDTLGMFVATDENDEANFVVRQIAKLAANDIPYRKLAIFYRTNAQSRAIEEALLKANIPYEIFGGFRFYERKEVKDIVAYLRLAINQRDNEALVRIINSPARGIGSSSVGQIQALATKQNMSLFATIEQICTNQNKLFSLALIKKLTVFYNLIKDLHSAAEETEKMVNGQDIDDGTKVFTFSKYIESLANKSGYLAKLKKDDEDDISRHENIMELVRVSQEFAKISLEQNEPILLRGFVERASLSSSSDQGNKNAGPPNSFNKQNNYVSLMTLHLAKGLEFDYVFITGLEDGLLPHSHSMMDAKDLEEERRLFYVGLTRAKLKLFLTYATSRNTYGRSSFCGGYSSRFLDHIPNNLLEATT